MPDLGQRPEGVIQFAPPLLELTGGELLARYERAMLALLDEDGQHLRLYADALEWESFAHHERVVPLDQALSAQAIQTRKAAFFTVSNCATYPTPGRKPCLPRGFDQYAACL